MFYDIYFLCKMIDILPQLITICQSGGQLQQGEIILFLFIIIIISL